MIRPLLACTVLCALEAARPSSHVEVGEVEAVLSLLQIGPPLLVQQTEALGRSYADEVFLQLRNALGSSGMSMTYGGLFFILAVFLAICCCPLPSVQGGKDQPPEILPPVSEKKPRPAPEASPSNCCCAGGILSWARRKGPQEEKENRNLPSSVTRTRQDEPRHRIIGFVPKPPEDYVDADGHVNFTGSWKCKSAEGDLDGVFADMGIGAIARTFMAGYGWGKGTVVRTYEQSGIHVKVTEKAIQETVQEFDVNGQEQRVNGGDFDFLQTSYWDPERPHVLHWTTADLAKAEPSKWTRTCQFFLDKDQLRIETTSSSGKVAYWIYERQM